MDTLSEISFNDNSFHIIKLVKVLVTVPLNVTQSTLWHLGTKTFLTTKQLIMLAYLHS